ncbi:MAG TPA: kelch repeat-containing protein, partial [Thermodesulfobacteriota bacterium]|nr:kelch repeat-containing protein [Thermodesulfobacteriota bacterium]
ELYDPTAGTFTLTTGSMTTVRWLHTATLLYNGKVLIAGGTLENGEGSLSSAELYDPTAGTFTLTTRSMTVGRDQHTATLLSNGKVLIAGPISAELYDPTAGTFTLTGSMTYWRYEDTATLLPSGKVLMAGGAFDSNSNLVTSAELYDPTTGTFTLTGSMTTATYQHTATLLSNGEVLIAGGEGYYSGIWETLSEAELYNPATGTFSQP